MCPQGLHNVVMSIVKALINVIHFLTDSIVQEVLSNCVSIHLEVGLNIREDVPVMFILFSFKSSYIET